MRHLQHLLLLGCLLITGCTEDVPLESSVPGKHYIPVSDSIGPASDAEPPLTTVFQEKVLNSTRIHASGINIENSNTSSLSVEPVSREEIKTITNPNDLTPIPSEKQDTTPLLPSDPDLVDRKEKDISVPIVSSTIVTSPTEASFDEVNVKENRMQADEIAITGGLIISPSNVTITTSQESSSQEKGSPCKYDYHCSPFQVCEYQSNGKRRCTCKKCKLRNGKVCGDDGKTYRSRCELDRAACLTKKKIKEVDISSCDNKLSSGKSFKGLVISLPSDSSVLHIKTVTSNDEISIPQEKETEHKPTDTDEHQEESLKDCPYGINVGNECQCRQSCPKIHKPVCGSDGHTYDNSCLMRSTSCRSNVLITITKKGECDIPIDPCTLIDCVAPKHCVVEDGKATCECPQVCPLLHAPVCGSDGKTYSSPCALEVANCNEDHDLREIHKGECTADGKANPEITCRNVRCGFGAECVEKGSGVRCVCQKKCLRGGSPVCGSDDKTYPSLCHLHQTMCRTRKNIQVKHPGLCGQENPCSQVICQNYSKCIVIDGFASCVCDYECSEVFQPVCGSDGRTYSNPCALESAACNLGLPIVKIHQGSCVSGNGCNNFPCQAGRVCRMKQSGEPLCVCRKFCPQSFETVCGTDGQTYQNECVLSTAACIRNIVIAVKHRGECFIMEHNHHPVYEGQTNPSNLLMDNYPPKLYQGGRRVVPYHHVLAFSSHFSPQESPYTKSQYSSHRSPLFHYPYDGGEDVPNKGHNEFVPEDYPEQLDIDDDYQDYESDSADPDHLDMSDKPDEDELQLDETLNRNAYIITMEDLDEEREGTDDWVF